MNTFFYRTHLCDAHVSILVFNKNLQITKNLQEHTSFMFHTQFFSYHHHQEQTSTIYALETPGSLICLTFIIIHRC